MSKNSENPDKNSQSEKQPSAQNANEKASGQTGNKNDDAAGKTPQSAREQADNKMDGQQADALLDLMSKDEKLLRDAIKNQRNSRIAPVEKDW